MVLRYRKPGVLAFKSSSLIIRDGGTCLDQLPRQFSTAAVSVSILYSRLLNSLVKSLAKYFFLIRACINLSIQETELETIN